MARFFISWNETNEPRIRWRIDVQCQVCDTRPYSEGNLRGGCIECAPLRARMNAVVHRREWWAWRKSLCADRSIWPMAADWIEEHGLGEVAADMRLNLPKWEQMALAAEIKAESVVIGL